MEDRIKEYYEQLKTSLETEKNAERMEILSNINSLSDEIITKRLKTWEEDYKQHSQKLESILLLQDQSEEQLINYFETVNGISNQSEFSTREQLKAIICYGELIKFCPKITLLKPEYRVFLSIINKDTDPEDYPFYVAILSEPEILDRIHQNDLGMIDRCCGTLDGLDEIDYDWMDADNYEDIINDAMIAIDSNLERIKENKNQK